MQVNVQFGFPWVAEALPAGLRSVGSLPARVLENLWSPGWRKARTPHS